MFQSTRPCGARQAQARLLEMQRQFQSTRPCGARHAIVFGLDPGCVVSIHAPLRGATVLLLLSPFLVLRFNPRAPAGRDRGINLSRRFLGGFNPRAPAGRDTPGKI